MFKLLPVKYIGMPDRRSKEEFSLFFSLYFSIFLLNLQSSRLIVLDSKNQNSYQLEGGYGTDGVANFLETGAGEKLVDNAVLSIKGLTGKKHPLTAIAACRKHQKNICCNFS